MCKCNIKDENGNEFCNNEVFENNDKCVLHCKKEDWFSIDKNKKIWNDKYVNEFWEKVRAIRIDSINNKQVLDYTNVIFPKFQEKVNIEKFGDNEEFFYEYDENFYSSRYIQYPDKFETLVKFDNAIFLDKTVFSDFNFEGGASFFNCCFYKGVSIINCNFNSINFNNVKAINPYIEQDYKLINFFRCELNKASFDDLKCDEVIFTSGLISHPYREKNNKPFFTNIKIKRGMSFKYVTLPKKLYFDKLENCNRLKFTANKDTSIVFNDFIKNLVMSSVELKDVILRKGINILNVTDSSFNGNFIINENFNPNKPSINKIFNF